MARGLNTFPGRATNAVWHPAADTVPDKSTILRFRHLLEQHQLTATVFDAVKTLLTEQRLLLKAGAMPIMRLMPVSVIGIVVGLGLGRVA